MTTHSSIYVGNDSVLALEGLQDRSGNLIEDATVTLESIVDKNGDAVDGITVPASLNHIANGNYELLVSKDVDISAGRSYKATVKAVSSGLTGVWVETLIAKTRIA